jgi:Domain of unknown function (DUF4304)
VTTAQQGFKEMMMTQVAPALREMGFKGSGESFHLPSASHWVLLGFQKSSGNTSSRVRFTINVTVVEKSIWEETRRERTFLPERPKPNVVYSRAWWMRIGRLPPDRRDRWWTVQADAPTEDVGHEVVAVIREHALAAIRDAIRRQAN